MNDVYHALFMACAGLLILACVAGAASGATYTYTEKNSNQTVKARLNDRIIIVLAENPTTGYLWNMTQTNGLLPVKDTYVTSDRTRRLVGAGGKHFWYYTVKKTGMQTITGVYARPWEGAGADSPRFMIRLNVTGPFMRR